MTTPERTSYCVPCDRVVVWRTWPVWQKHLQRAVWDRALGETHEYWRPKLRDDLK